MCGLKFPMSGLIRRDRILRPHRVQAASLIRLVVPQPLACRAEVMGLHQRNRGKAGLMENRLAFRPADRDPAVGACRAVPLPRGRKRRPWNALCSRMAPNRLQQWYAARRYAARKRTLGPTSSAGAPAASRNGNCCGACASAGCGRGRRAGLAAAVRIARMRWPRMARWRGIPFRCGGNTGGTRRGSGRPHRPRAPRRNPVICDRSLLAFWRPWVRCGVL